MPDEIRTIEAVRALFEMGDANAVDGLLAENIELRPPTYGKSWTGEALVSKLLQYAASSFTDFRYTDTISTGSTHVMRFEAKIDEQEISGVDLLHFDNAGKIATFEIFSRPPKAALALRDKMGAHVKSDRVVAAMMGL